MSIDPKCRDQLESWVHSRKAKTTPSVTSFDIASDDQVEAVASSHPRSRNSSLLFLQAAPRRVDRQGLIDYIDNHRLFT
jgi:hypothetical protein